MRSYFPGLRARQTVLGTLLIIAEPVHVADQVIGGVRVSYSVDRRSLEIGEAMQLPPAVIFYAPDMNGQGYLYRGPALMFDYPSDMGSETLNTAVAKMLSQPSGTIECIFRDMYKTVFFEKSSVPGWVFALGFSEPAIANIVWSPQPRIPVQSVPS